MAQAATRSGQAIKCTRQVVFSADDFGLSVAVNEAVEQAHRQGLLHAASLMVAGPAAADAVVRAHANPGLRVGLHLVVIEGPAVLPPAAIPGLVNANGWFPSDQLRLGLRYFFRPDIRRQLAAEIRAQYEAFAATGLPLGHADAHKHMHLHPVVGQQMIAIGAEFGLRAIRVPAEPPAVMAALGAVTGLGAHALYLWTRLLRRQACRAGLATTDQVFGLGWSGQMHGANLMRLIPRLPRGLSEVYFHPASRTDPLLDRLMPGYAHRAELDALLDPLLPGRLRAAGIWTELPA